MVDEFAAFARVPKPVMEPGDLRDAVQEPVILFREGHPTVKFVLAMPEQPISASFDRRLITQAVTNLVKNATEAVETAAGADVKTNAGWKPIVVTRSSRPRQVEIEVIDNGMGLPKQNRSACSSPT